MALIVDPFREMERAAARTRGHRPMPMDLYKSEDTYVLRLDLPGVAADTIDLDVDGTMLTVRAQRPTLEQDVQWIARGRATGEFVRRFTLGEGLDVERIAADYTDGVLTLTVPVAERAKPRKIEVRHGAVETVEHTEAA